MMRVTLQALLLQAGATNPAGRSADRRPAMSELPAMENRMAMDNACAWGWHGSCAAAGAAGYAASLHCLRPCAFPVTWTAVCLPGQTRRVGGLTVHQVTSHSFWCGSFFQFCCLLCFISIAHEPMFAWHPSLATFHRQLDPHTMTV